MIKAVTSRANLPALRQFRVWLFEPPPEPRTWHNVIRWWEKRRLFYNLFIGGIGFCSFVLFLVIMSQPGMVESSEDAVEPMAIFASPILINICYSFGEIIEIWALRRRDGRKFMQGAQLLRIGLIFSLIMVLLPTVLSGIALAVRLIRG